MFYICLSEAVPGLKCKLYRHDPVFTYWFEQLKPWLAGSEPPARQAAVAAQLGLSEGALKVAIHRLRKRFREAILHELRQTLPDTDDPEDELRYLIEVLSQA
jgi:hypothetical protein